MNMLKIEGKYINGQGCAGKTLPFQIDYLQSYIDVYNPCKVKFHPGTINILLNNELEIRPDSWDIVTYPHAWVPGFGGFKFITFLKRCLLFVDNFRWDAYIYKSITAEGRESFTTITNKIVELLCPLIDGIDFSKAEDIQIEMFVPKYEVDKKKVYII